MNIGQTARIRTGRNSQPWTRLTAIAFLVLLLSTGCAGPTAHIDALAASYGFDVGTIEAQGFRLRTCYHRGAATVARLHVYLEGDGRPWQTRTRISLDPTPKRPLALELMAIDRQPSLYLGRPCYFGEAQSPGCSPLLWTSARYSETVVDAMTNALRQIIAEKQVQQLTLIGYSGGGVLAWLLAKRLPEATRLVTVAANLDVAAWTNHHGYSPLSLSLDPALSSPLPERVQHWHLIGTRDTVVPPSLSADPPGPELTRARIRRIASDHRCCWFSVWSTILQEIDHS